jgi:hypothetical protein
LISTFFEQEYRMLDAPRLSVVEFADSPNAMSFPTASTWLKAGSPEEPAVSLCGEGIWVPQVSSAAADETWDSGSRNNNGVSL